MCCGLRFVLIALLEPVQLCHMNSNGIWVGKGTRATLGVVEDGFALSETASDHWMRGYKYMLRVRHTRAHGSASSPPHPFCRAGVSASAVRARRNVGGARPVMANLPQLPELRS